MATGLAPYGFRHAEKVSDPFEPKGKGYFGKLPAKGGTTSTEISASNEKGESYPLLVPGLTKAEMQRLLDGKKPTEAMYEKAEKHAEKRKAEGKSAFAKDEELRFPKPEMKKGGKVTDKWIQKAIKKPGALRAQLGAKEGQPIPAKKLAAAAKKPGKLGQRARLAETLGKMKKK